MSGRQLIRMRGIVKRFYIGQPNELEILHGIDLDVKEGEFVSIVGASGSGKSTLMNMIGVLDRPTEGTYWLDGTDVQDAQDDELSQIRNRKIGFVFQNFNLISRTNARKNVELPMMYAGIPQKNARREPKSFWIWSAWQTAWTISRTSFPADRSSVSPSRAPWQMTRRLSLPTSRQVRLTARRGAWSWICFTGSTANRGRQLFSLRTIRSWQRRRAGC